MATIMQLVLAIFISLAVPLCATGENKSPFPRSFQNVVSKLEWGHFDEAREYLSDHPDAIRDGIKAGGKPLSTFVFRPNHPAYHLTPQHLQMAFEISLEHGASPDEPSVLYTLLKTQRAKLADLLLDNQPRPDVGGSYLAAAVWGEADEATIARLIQLKANVNLYDPQFESVPLMVAVRCKHESAARLLLKSGADVNHADEAGRTALHEAIAQRGDAALISLLLGNGADANRMVEAGYRPIELAVHHPQAAAVVSLLHEHGAELTPAAMIILMRTEDLARVVADEKSANRIEPVGKQTFLQIAAQHDNAAAVKLLLAHGARIDGSPHPLHTAVAGGYLQVSQRLLANGANADAEGPHGRTPLHVAARDGRAELVALLLSHGASVHAATDSNTFTQGGWQPLHFAVAGGHHDIARQLCRAGALRPRNEALIVELEQLATQSGDKRMLQVLEIAM